MKIKWNKYKTDLVKSAIERFVSENKIDSPEQIVDYKFYIEAIELVRDIIDTAEPFKPKPKPLKKGFVKCDNCGSEYNTKLITHCLCSTLVETN